MYFALFALMGLASAKMCVNNTVTVNLSANNVNFNISAPKSQYEVTMMVQFLARQGQNATDRLASGFHSVNGTYTISTQFCRPDNMTGSNPVVQVLTHGVGFDKTYWDLSYDNYNYSYVNQATDTYGYCTLSYDRLGVGNSSKGEPINEIQLNLEVEALNALTSLLRTGSFPGVNHTFTTVLHAGHSFGSELTYALVNTYPDASNGIALTGFSTNSSFMSQFTQAANFANANVNQPLRFGNYTLADIQSLLFKDITNPLFNYIAGITSLPPSQNLPNGYLVASNAAAIQALFFAPPFFDYTGLLPLAEETKQAATIGELLTTATLAPTNSFTGPVLVITGDQDTPFCGGNCLATGDPMVPSVISTTQKSFPNVPAGNFLAYVQPNTGHALNFHYNATGAYSVINSFFGRTVAMPSR
ncbi:MAG: hypothetical protein GOMPHAMPRED_004777 [Gomphillus americanus]|uniref:AB hydrolase-1 domain-containing protein n=1 Tax=Gomphillus americanus TaxID=1940652 RepID=A0A8H3EPE6_9LECA|nr:MAG: hypothetical protein GOMPHAMPRED_004777 [Gomphillus americanus]